MLFRAASSARCIVEAMTRRPRRRRGRTAKSYALEIAVTIAFLVLMIGVVLPAAGRYMSDRAVEQFIPSSTASAATGGSAAP